MAVSHLARTLALGMLVLTMAAPACAETATGKALIVEGDLPSARQAALRDAMWNAGMDGTVSVATRSASIGSRHQDAILVSQQEHLKHVKIDAETVADGWLTLRISFDRTAAGEQTACGEDKFGLGNIRVEWQFPRPTSSAFRNTDAQALVRTRLDALLRGDARGWFADSNAETSALRLSLSLQRDEASWWRKDGHRIHYAVLGPEELVISSGDIDLAKGDLARRAKYNLGYTSLGRLELTPEAEASLQEASKSIAKVLRCIPPVARIVLDPEGKATVRLGQARTAVQNDSLLLFTLDFPIRSGGDVDIAAVAGNMRIENTQGGLTTLKLLPGSGIKTQAGLAGYVIFY